MCVFISIYLKWNRQQLCMYVCECVSCIIGNNKEIERMILLNELQRRIRLWYMWYNGNNNLTTNISIQDRFRWSNETHTHRRLKIGSTKLSYLFLFFWITNALCLIRICYFIGTKCICTTTSSLLSIFVWLLLSFSSSIWFRMTCQNWATKWMHSTMHPAS